MRKANAPKVLLIILLLVLGSLLIVATGTKLGDLLMPNVEAGADAPKTETPLDQPPPVADNLEPTPPAPDNPKPTTDPEPAFPIAPASHDRFLYQQTVKGKLFASHYTATGYYIVVQEAEIFYLYRMDEGGTLLGRAKLSTGEYLSSQLTADGIAVLLKGEKDTRLYLSTPDLTVSRLPLPKGNVSKFFALNEGFLLQLDDTVYSMANGVIAASAKLLSANLVEVFATAEGYTLILNVNDGFSVTMLDFNLKTYSENTVSNRTVLGFRPVVDDKKMKYAVLEAESGMLYLTVYDSTFRPATARRAGLGQGADGALFASETGLFVLAKGDDPRIYLSDFELNFSLGDRTPFRGLTALHGVEQYESGYLALLEKENALYFLEVRNDGTTATKHIDEDVNAAIFHRTTKGAVFLSDGEGEEEPCVTIVSLNLFE